ncbi:GGDEF domain-containing protein [Photobacterium damselae]|uniref:GGDEF domain-containing protein n=1 Tax=Photobacterium damselae TaxID=38293 RepID=UPI002F41AF33
MADLRQRLRYTAYWLVSITIIVYGWFYFGGAEKELVITPKNSTFRLIDDSHQGGASTAELDINPDSAILNCELVKKSQWPFCEMAISLSDSVAKGFDLSKYHAIGLDIDYDSPVEGERVRIYLRNYDESYSNETDPVSLKFNAIEYAPGKDQGLQVIPLKSFQVLSWWIAEYELPIEKAGPQFDNVSIIEIATGSYVKPTHYGITLNKLVLYGTWISEENLVKILLVIWIITALVFLTTERIRLFKQIQNAEQKAARLKTMNKVLYEKSLHFEELAYIDPLTKAKNRNAVSDWVRQVVEHSKDMAQPFSVIYIDIDFFKKINDKYGHGRGDEVLAKFADLLRKNIDKTDMLVRWGGEEFVVFCPSTSLGVVAEKAEFLREAIAEYQWGDEFSVTCSLGVAQLENEEFNRLMERADEALYKAKERGRNRVEIAWD